MFKEEIVPCCFLLRL